MPVPMVRADGSLAVTTIPGSRVLKGAAAEPRTHPNMQMTEPCLPPAGLMPGQSGRSSEIATLSFDKNLKRSYGALPQYSPIARRRPQPAET